MCSIGIIPDYVCIMEVGIMSKMVNWIGVIMVNARVKERHILSKMELPGLNKMIE